MQRLRNPAARHLSAYRAWQRACLRSAWRETHFHFSGRWRTAGEILLPGLTAALALHIWGNADGVTTIATGAAASALWMFIVFCWNASLAPYRLWRAALARTAKAAVVRRIDPRIIRRELALCIRLGQALMDSRSPSKRQLAAWYERVLRAVSRSGQGNRAMIENMGPAPGTRGGPLELLILGNRLERLRLILDRQPPGPTPQNSAPVAPRRAARA